MSDRMPKPSVPVSPEDVIADARFAVSSALRDWIHGTALSECNAGADTCPDWPLAAEVRDIAFEALARAGFVVVPSEPTDDDIDAAARAARRIHSSGGVDLPAPLEAAVVLHWRRNAVAALDAFLAPYRSTEDPNG
jgi:hypothetical protein